MYPLVVWLFLAGHPSERSLLYGALVALIGEALRLWANGYVGHVKVNSARKEKVGRFITAGPYAHVRHPLYVGTFLIGAGFCVAVTSAWAALGALAMFYLLYRRKAMEEEALILEEYGQAYEAYRRAVPRWMPTWRRYQHPNGQWRWAGVKASKEWKTLIWIVVGLFAVYFREEFWQEREVFTGKDWLKHVILAAMCIGLMAVDGFVELRQRIRPSPISSA